MSGELSWFKSSYSDSEGSECVEVALSWRKATYSDSEGSACVEAATCPAADAIHVRDSKNVTGPALTFPAPAWRDFLILAAGR
ncbi:DUF397 domain-containing protein [Streptomyces piniterrae]|uniref:DUF397 domain-containing protein n=1 Tax=Streptomyces piniterrae TaxID=2571125 RepID=A0A4U0N8C4_9ACTN|nr:DUF397 domain-containing protein [Streptomyces piniterrae]TJZ50107.1 DUF397 domain-containing protein [Streptomyces piniterrae]